MNEHGRIMYAAKTCYQYVGYVELDFVRKMTGIPQLIIENVLKNEGFIESPIEGQYIKKNRNNEKEDCPVCHGAGATTDHHDPCTECGGSGKVGGEE